MAFQPNALDSITLNKNRYLLGEHPAWAERLYCQEGRQGFVYQLIPEGANTGFLAMKVFKSNFRIPSLVYRSELMHAYSAIKGLVVSNRTVIIPQNEFELLAKHNDLMYAVVMPWVYGPKWYDVLMDKQPMTRSLSRKTACSLAQILASMEQMGLAHCDLSAANLILPGHLETYDSESNEMFFVELVDIEQMYGIGLEKPELLEGGSPGYSDQLSNKEPIWNKYSDRFSGAILICEMLAWSIEEIRLASWGGSYFAPEEIKQDSDRFRLMHAKLEQHWGSAIATLFIRTWDSGELIQCPTFGEWYVAVMSSTEMIEAVNKNVLLPSWSFQNELAQARELEKFGNIPAALLIYNSIKDQLPETDSLYREIEIHLNDYSKRSEIERVSEDFEKKVTNEQLGNKANLKKRMIYILGGFAVLILCSAMIFNQSGKPEKNTEALIIQATTVQETIEPSITKEPTVVPTQIVTPEPTPTLTVTATPKSTIKPTPVATAIVNHEKPLKILVKPTSIPIAKPTSSPVAKPTQAEINAMVNKFGDLLFQYKIPNNIILAKQILNKLSKTSISRDKISKMQKELKETEKLIGK
ncbi:hypothetical protein EHS13_17465 [Paenibacillus psychroresistens]|uniref:Protein kinase domain-containing protein n=1 Tax=Paenibacillus psychroresistens TaxID=1778678 RepID=A0A6B8RL16_9BACL|nr:hypothetical protein [Paenibacillus psychroresistens]QGQ96547.1 hypothetical protein EHS13_17465 [Paenibacillus psychroresistens]